MEALYEAGDPRNLTPLRAAFSLFLCEMLSASEVAVKEGSGLAVTGRGAEGAPTGASLEGNAPRVEPPGIRRAREFLDGCPMPWPKVPELAELAGMSLSHFHACFARETGMAPLAYAHLVRLEQARRLLRRKGSTVTRVAAELGYCSGQHLAGVFRRYLGITPTQAVKEGAG
jgi:AraC-like DNA-binding protein